MFHTILYCFKLSYSFLYCFVWTCFYSVIHCNIIENINFSYWWRRFRVWMSSSIILCRWNCVSDIIFLWCGVPWYDVLWCVRVWYGVFYNVVFGVYLYEWCSKTGKGTLHFRRLSIICEYLLLFLQTKTWKVQSPICW